MVEFNKLPLEFRKYVIENNNPHDKQKTVKMKLKLRNFFRKSFQPNGEITKEKRNKILQENIFSRERVEKKKQDMEEKSRKRKITTPLGKSNRTESATFRRAARLSRAPYREYRSFGLRNDEPPEKRPHLTPIGEMKNFPETPKKRKRANSSYSSVHNKRRCHQHAVLEVNDLHDTGKSPDMDRGNTEIASVNQTSTGALRNAGEPVNSSAERVVQNIRHRENECDSRAAFVENQQKSGSQQCTQRYNLRSTVNRSKRRRIDTPDTQNTRAGHHDMPD